LPPRDEKDYEGKRQQIIDGAMQVFSTKGFERATNKDIARAAKIGSPGLIYHYFKDKADLFRSVLYERAPVLYLFDHTEDLMDLPPREALTIVATGMMKAIESHRSTAMFRIFLSEAVRRPAVAEVFSRIGPQRVFAFLTAYLQKQMDAGVLRQVDTGAAARSFIGPLIVYVLTKEVFVLPDADKLAPQTMVETLVDIFLRGLETSPGETEAGR
jgi:TetR/AcrR family transcriptional regulator, mexJK operon transcriptional repressor